MQMTVGTIVDYCIENQNAKYQAEKEQKKGVNKRRATQADWSAFLG